MISASIPTLSLNNLKILRPKVMKNLTNFCKNFCESPTLYSILLIHYCPRCYALFLQPDLKREWDPYLHFSVFFFIAFERPNGRSLALVNLIDTLTYREEWGGALFCILTAIICLFYFFLRTWFALMTSLRISNCVTQ